MNSWWHAPCGFTNGHMVIIAATWLVIEFFYQLWRHL